MTVTAMTVEVSTSCSLSCVGCARTIGKSQGRWRDEFMSADLFRRICPNLPDLQRLNLNGIGEPTLNPDYLDIVSIAGRSGRFDSIFVTTHGLARTAFYFRQLAEAGMTNLSISVDSLTQSVADATRTGTDVARLRRRLEELSTLPIAIAITTVASRFNKDDLSKTFDALNVIGGFAVNVQPYLDLGRPEGCLTPAERAEVRDLVMSGRWPKLRMGINSPIVASDAFTVCNSPWASPAVTVDGYLTPCCVMWDPATLGYLSIAEMTVAEAFERSSYQAFLRNYMQCAPAFCAACSNNVRPVAEQFVALMRHPSERTVALSL